MSKVKKIFNASLLIAGTTIGAGMLALPIVTASCGFLPSIVLFFVCYLFMLATGLLLVEALVWFKGEYNLVSLSTTLLGKWGKFVSWGLYLFLFYTLTVAYTAGGSDILIGFLKMPKALAEVLFVGFLSIFVMQGTKSVHRINYFLMIGMVVSYLALMLTGWPKINLSYLKTYDFSKALYGLPVIFTSFSYQGIVPSVKTYLDGDIKALKKALVVGISIPFVFYIIWQAFIMGLIPQEFLVEASNLGKSAVAPLEKKLDAPWIFHFGTLFAFFAITTSFLGVTLGLKDFLKDGLQIPGNKNRFFLFMVTFIPPFFIAQFSFNVFISALRFAGGIGCALLLGLMPILMVWKGRYKIGHPPRLGWILNHRSVLFALAAFVVFEVLLELKFLLIK
jgi:tyrosine-specific transport protein